MLFRARPARRVLVVDSIAESAGSAAFAPPFSRDEHPGITADQRASSRRHCPTRAL